MPEHALPVEFLFHIVCDTSETPPTLIDSGPHGTRFIVDATSGSFEGPKLAGRVHGPGGDWSTLTSDGTVRVDVRLQMQTDDGADILMTYTGVGVTVDGELQLRTTPRFEVGDARYVWLNQVQAVATGRLGENGVEYDVYQLL